MNFTKPLKVNIVYADKPINWAEAIHEIDHDIPSHQASREVLFMVGKNRNHFLKLALDSSGRALGYVIYIADTSHYEILYLAVHPNFRRLGIGTQLLRHLVDKLDSRKKPRIYFAVREQLLDCHLFLRGFCARDSHAHFQAVGIQRDYFTNPVEDAFIFMYRRLPEFTTFDRRRVLDRLLKAQNVRIWKNRIQHWPFLDSGDSKDWSI